ncbi:MAG: DEAD/DEAH box helicase family protein [Gammaproteobacteria bacterium AqS3]|nr:DEAD/DEAH box helicase family protein [Gammaproteobacteria bacterium AqS3]
MSAPQFQYKPQQFQRDAVDAIVDVFQGLDIGQFQDASADSGELGQSVSRQERIWPIELFQRCKPLLEDNLKQIQKKNRISETKLELDTGYLTLDTQMETGTGKTFTFINAIFELNREHGLTHFIVITPSIAIKEGIKKSFATTKNYFQQLYSEEIKVHEMGQSQPRKGRKSAPAGLMDFVYSQRLTVLIMTSHAFNKQSNLINQRIEGFNYPDAETPMEAIASKRPVLIIDEPQRVEGTQTREYLPKFNPLFVLRYTATFRESQEKNLVYVLDSYDAFSQNLVKQITVTDYTPDPTDSAFLGVHRLMPGKGTGNQQVELVVMTQAAKLKKITVGVQSEEKESKLFKATQNPDYKDLRVTRISRKDETVTLSDGRTLKVGVYRGHDEINGRVIAEAMLRDTVEKHLDKEQRLYERGIKCLSLFFIEKVKDYDNYDDERGDGKGWLLELFEEVYRDCRNRKLKKLQREGASPYLQYLSKWKPHEVHGGYFSSSAQSNRKIDQGAASGEGQEAGKLQQEITDRILKNKEKILSLDDELRFIFAHSALREGWDNPNVFQICKLRESYSNISIVQEVGRGLRICVNKDLRRQDREEIGSEFSAVNNLDVLTLGNGSFIKDLQKELAQRRSTLRAPVIKIAEEDLKGIYELTSHEARKIMVKLNEAGAIDGEDQLLDSEKLSEVLKEEGHDPQLLIEGKKIPGDLYSMSSIPCVVDSRRQHSREREYQVSTSHYRKFKQLWKMLHQKVIYEVKYSEDFQGKAATAIDKLEDIYPADVMAAESQIEVRDEQFGATEARQRNLRSQALTSSMKVRQFLNKLANKTQLPRNSVIQILSQIKQGQYEKIQSNPFLALEKVADAINGVILNSIVDNIRYHKLEGQRETRITLTDRKFSATDYIDLNDLKKYQGNNLWQEIAPYDSRNPEKDISENALENDQIVVFAKIPRAVNIPAPMHPKGINPDFAFIVNSDGDQKYYFVAEAKPTMNEDDLVHKGERHRVQFMKKYFEGIDERNLKFKVISGYRDMVQMWDAGEGE